LPAAERTIIVPPMPRPLVPSVALVALVGVGLASGGAACSSSRATSPPLATGVGDLAVRVLPDTANVTIAGPDGALLEGLDASDDVGTPASENDDAPPMTGFAVRDVTTRYEMLFGSFKITDDTSKPWRVARRTRGGAGGAPLDLLAADGARLATLTFTQGGDARHAVIAIEPGDGPERRFSWGFRCAPTDHFVGFGAQTWGVDARKETIPLWVSEEGIGKNLTSDDPGVTWYAEGRRHSSQMPLPEFLSRRGFMAVAETDRLSTFALCSERDDVARMQLELPVKLHVFYGPSPHDAITRMTAHFGRPRVPPAFAFAPWNDAIFGSDNVRRIARKLRDAGAPSSVIWTEDWRGGEWNGDRYSLVEEWDLDRTLYPDFEAVARDLHADGFKWLLYFNPFVQTTTRAWPETAPNGLLVRKSDGSPYTFGNAKFEDASLVDLSDPRGKAWAVAKMKAAIALGADGWMGDYAEWLPTDATLTGGSGLDLHNRYPVLWQEAQRQALDESMSADGVERLSFVRSGWFGTTALADVFWAGDQRTSFDVDDGMPTVLPIGIGVGVAGISTFGSDIGGYQNTGNGPVTKELFFRWTELGAWSPVMRTHHGSSPKLNWSFESDDETLALWTRYAKVHVALAPYFRSLAQAAHDTGIAIWRALALEFPDDEASWPVADEVMVGDGLLVAPVQAAGALERIVYLPPGRWFPWGGGASVDGGRTLTAAAPLGEIPVFAKAGAIVPMLPDGVDTLVREPSNVRGLASVKDDRVVVAFAGASGAFTEIAESGALGYTLESAVTAATGAATATWNGAPLGACAATAVAPCVVIAGGTVTAHVTGPGALRVTRGADVVATLTAASGRADRKLTLTIRF
jgi:alpha-glucosidase (family GH31 glycosyl hydrolase)